MAQPTRLAPLAVTETPVTCSRRCVVGGAAAGQSVGIHRESLYFLTWRDIKVRYKQTILRAIWAVIQPFMTMVVFSMFFGRLVQDSLNEEGVHIFSANDTDPVWRQRPRPAGRYVSTAWIPGNLLAEGMLFVDAALTTLDPNIYHFTECQVVAFQIVGTLEGDTARGDWAGQTKGVLRPLLQWQTHGGQLVHSTMATVAGEK